MRDIIGFVETRRKLLSIKPANKIHWIAYAVGNHLAGKYETATKVRSLRKLVVPW
jgi:N-alpha-acetyltransferase 15/16, NatA auxiliary subunit